MREIKSSNVETSNNVPYKLISGSTALGVLLLVKSVFGNVVPADVININDAVITNHRASAPISEMVTNDQFIPPYNKTSISDVEIALAKIMTGQGAGPDPNPTPSGKPSGILTTPNPTMTPAPNYKKKNFYISFGSSYNHTGIPTTLGAYTVDQNFKNLMGLSVGTTFSIEDIVKKITSGKPKLEKLLFEEANIKLKYQQMKLNLSDSQGYCGVLKLSEFKVPFTLEKTLASIGNNKGRWEYYFFTGITTRGLYLDNNFYKNRPDLKDTQGFFMMFNPTIGVGFKVHYADGGIIVNLGLDTKGVISTAKYGKELKNAMSGLYAELNMIYGGKRK